MTIMLEWLIKGYLCHTALPTIGKVRFGYEAQTLQCMDNMRAKAHITTNSRLVVCFLKAPGKQAVVLHRDFDILNDAPMFMFQTRGIVGES